MREKIILAPGLNGNEMMKSLALHGVNSIGTRICGATELARLALMRSGISIAEDFISIKEEASLVAEAVNGEPYFGKASYSDILEIATAIRRMRSLITEKNEGQILQEKLSSGIFIEKNRALLDVYQRYMEGLASREALDAISLIRKAAKESKIINADFLVLKEFPLSPLEKMLLGHVSGGSFVKVSIQVLFGETFRSCNVNMSDLCAVHGINSSKIQIENIWNCYGAPNEVETILTDIYAGKSIDQSTVAVTDVLTYGQLFFDYALQYDIPVTFGCGIPIMNSNPGRLLALYYKWMTSEFYGAAAIREMISSKAFDRSKLYELLPKKDEIIPLSTFYEILGDLRFTDNYDVNKNRIADFRKAVDEEAALTRKKDTKRYQNILRKKNCIPFLEILSRELSLPVEEFISKYAYIRKGNDSNAGRLLMMLDISASKAIYEELKTFRSSGHLTSSDDLIPNIMKITVCPQQSEAGKLHVTGILGAFGTLRNHLYLAGMSASVFPGSPKENYLLLDADLQLFGSNAKTYMADGRILQKRLQFLALVHQASALGIKITVSYAGLNVSELKKDNPSSLIFELLREAYGQSNAAEDLESHITRVDYFEPAISASRLVGKAYVKGNTIIQSLKDTETGTPAVPWDLDRAWSPTALDTFFDCPRRFMLGYILGIPEPKDYDPFSIINALDNGKLTHLLMEELGGSDMSREEFLALSEEYFVRYVEEHPPLIPENVPSVEEQFLEMMETAYNMDPHREVVLEEEDIHCIHESGVRIHGYPDRVERLEDGTYLVVDFKSGRMVSHVQDDIGTCLQVIIYSYLMEQKGYQVSGCEYRYIRLGEVVSCKYDEDIKRQLYERLQLFNNSLEEGFFPIAAMTEEDDDPCKYCKYTAICGKANEEGTVN